MMNSLTVNLHLLLTSFYRPDGRRRLILMESPAFPSDIYCLQSHVRLVGSIRTKSSSRSPRWRADAQDIRHRREDRGSWRRDRHRDDGWIEFPHRPVLDMPAITEAGHRVGAMVGFDLAHAAGNIILNLHDWNVDFAAWCSYKYLNASPGAIAGVFVHERRGQSGSATSRGLVGHDPDTRFQMHLRSVSSRFPTSSLADEQSSHPGHGALRASSSCSTRSACLRSRTFAQTHRIPPLHAGIKTWSTVRDHHPGDRRRARLPAVDSRRRRRDQGVLHHRGLWRRRRLSTTERGPDRPGSDVQQLP